MQLVEKAKREYQNIPIDLIKSPLKPSREVFEDINVLAQTIKAHGLLQPLLVKQLAGAYGFEVIVGERRVRACRKAGLTKIPCIVLDEISEEQVLQMQLTENLQRSDLKVFEEIRIVESLKDNYNLSNDEIAVKIGLSASTVASYLTIAKGLPQKYIRMVERGKGRTHTPKALTITKALILARANLPEDKLKETVDFSSQPVNVGGS
jgi:ParB family chromosome partitioning protein